MRHGLGHAADRMCNNRKAVRASLEMSIERPCICPLVVARAADQTALTTKFEARDDPAVLKGYAALLTQVCATVPDGVVAFFPSCERRRACESAGNTHAHARLRARPRADLAPRRTPLRSPRPCARADASDLDAMRITVPGVPCHVSYSLLQRAAAACVCVLCL